MVDWSLFGVLGASPRWTYLFISVFFSVRQCFGASKGTKNILLACSYQTCIAWSGVSPINCHFFTPHCLVFLGWRLRLCRKMHLFPLGLMLSSSFSCGWTAWIQVVYLKETYVPEEFADLLEVLLLNGNSTVLVVLGLHDTTHGELLKASLQHLL